MVFLRVGVFSTGLPFVTKLVLRFALDSLSEILISALISANCHEMQLCLQVCGKAHTVTALAIVATGDELKVQKENFINNTYAVVEEGHYPIAPQSMEIRNLPSLVAPAAEGGSGQTAERAMVHFCNIFPG